jgi:hypothetical protein
MPYSGVVYHQPAYYPNQTQPYTNTTYTPPITTHTPLPLQNQHPPANNHNPPPFNEPHIRTPSVELPIFYGDNAYQWLQDYEGVFDLAGINNDHKMKWAAAHIRGKAKVWINNCNVQP